MSKYTAPHRSTSNRGLSRRACIVLLTSLLVPASLLAIASLPASAAAKYATIQDVQDAINAALAPVQSAIASLQTEQTTQATQISNLQNSTSKSLMIYDADSNALGQHTDDQWFYNPQLSRLVHYTAKSNFAILAPNVTLYYQSTDCTGAPYTTPPETMSTPGSG